MKKSGKIFSMILKLILLIVISLSGFLALLFFFQKKMIYFPDRELEASPSDIGLEYEDIFLTTEDRVKISAWFIPSSNLNTDAVNIIFCHGNAGNISHRLHSIMQFHKLGCNVLIFDYRGYGLSEGSPSEKGTYLDADAAYDYIIRRFGNDTKIILFGRSLGGAVAAEIASRRKANGIIIESSFTSIPDMAAKLYPFLPVRFLCRIKYDTLSKMGAIKCPVLIVHSPEDEIVPYQMGRRLFEAANEPKFFLQISGSHNDGYILSGSHYLDGLRDFIHKNTL